MQSHLPEDLFAGTRTARGFLRVGRTKYMVAPMVVDFKCPWWACVCLGTTPLVFAAPRIRAYVGA